MSAPAINRAEGAEQAPGVTIRQLEGFLPRPDDYLNIQAAGKDALVYQFCMMVGNCDVLITAPSSDVAPRVRQIVGEMDLAALSAL